MTDTQTDTDPDTTPHIDALVDLCHGLPYQQAHAMRSSLTAVRDAMRAAAPHGDPSFYEDIARKARLDIMRTLATATLDMHIALVAAEGKP